MKNYRVGIVVPVYLTTFIKDTIKYLEETINSERDVVCIVNDGMEDVKEYLKGIELKENMYILNLPKNLCFSGSNNAGFKFLLEKYPDLEYLGSLNDDTIPKEKWLDEMVGILDKKKDVVAVTPRIFGIDKITGQEIPCCAIFMYGQGCQMLSTVQIIEEDAYTKLFCGFCFICRKKEFEEVGYLDENYKNGAEDMDLSLKFLTKGYKMMVAAKAKVVHFGGSSRSTRINGGQEISESISHLFSKWGHDLTKYNEY